MTIVVEPNPAIEGQPVSVSVDGPGPHYWRVAGQEWQEVPVDEETGRGRIDVPPGTGGGVLDVSDRRSPSADATETPIDAPE